MRLLKKNTFLYTLYKWLLTYPTPVNLTYLWNFGSLAGLTLALQICTGVALAMWYVASVDLAFASVEFIMQGGAVGVVNSLFARYRGLLVFLVVYILLARGTYYGFYVGK